MKLTTEYVQNLLKKTETAITSVEVVNAQGQAVLDMAQRYLDDANHFFEQNDLEKAMAAEEYAHGLLDGAVGSSTLKISKPENAELFVFK